ncbi:MAG: hypothetical protein RBU21_02855 [FCB group bacterium]|jgi:hypothetical protein|nr:hypothetical protein [FCB group bacterium]
MTEVETPTTEEVVIGMLAENTGRHFLDSGGAYGRNWERNQGRDFRKDLSCFYSFSVYGSKLGVDASISLYRWVVHNLEYDPEMQARLDLYAEDRPDASAYELAEGFADEEQQRHNYEWVVDAEGFPRGINTYNDPDTWGLSQVIQFQEVAAEGSYCATHLILQVHGGCDVRGGYTMPKCFRIRSGGDCEWIETAQTSTVWAGDWWWEYEGSWLGRIKSWCGEGQEVPPSLPDSIFKLTAVDTSLDEEIDPDILDDWHIEVPDPKTALLVAPRGYTNDDDDVGPWPISIGNSYL